MSNYYEKNACNESNEDYARAPDTPRYVHIYKYMKYTVWKTI